MLKPLTGTLLGLALFLAPGCTPKPISVTPASATEIVVKDDLGREVRLPKPAERIICLAPAHTETLYALGVGDKVVAADTYSDYPAEVKPKAKLQCWPRPPLDQIVAEAPDLVVMLTQDHDFARQMDAAKIPVMKLFPKTVEQALAEIEVLGRVVGREAEAKRIVADQRARIAAVGEKLKGVSPPSYLYEMDAVDPVRPYVAGSGGFYNDIMGLAGGSNVFADLKVPAAQVTAEQIIARDPQVILLGDTRSPVQPQSPEKVRNRAGWNTVAAVKTGRIHPVNSDLITRAGPRMAEGVETVAALFHPERFK